MYKVIRKTGSSSSIEKEFDNKAEAVDFHLGIVRLKVSAESSLFEDNMQIGWINHVPERKNTRDGIEME
jgi:hypothetical protein